MSNPADLSIKEAATAFRRRDLSSRELVDACLRRIRERDGTHSYEGDPESINAWVRVYEEDALAAADRADALISAGDSHELCGIPIGLKDLYEVKGKPVTASSRVLDEVPDRDCDVWARLSAEGMVLLGHVHTHEFAAGGTTDQTGNPWALNRTPGGSSGGSSAALASGTVLAATGTDTAGSLRIPSSMCGTSTIKPTRRFVSTNGIVPLAPTLDVAGPMTRELRDCEPLLAAMTGSAPSSDRRPIRRIALSPRIDELDQEVAEGLERALGAIDAEQVEPPPPDHLDVFDSLAEVLCLEMLPYHRRFDDLRHLYRPSIRGFLERAESRAMTAEEYAALQFSRAELDWTWTRWFNEHSVDALIEPTIPVIPRERGPIGYGEPFNDGPAISLTHYWNWTGMPVVAIPSGIGSVSGLPTGVSLIGASGSDWRLLAWGVELQAELGIPSPPAPLQ
jgi:aspartyl-tRNA(Asn)/glutamyl-tRNA(Gln) amidotransferase subunit A